MRTVLESNEHQAPQRVPKLTLEIRATRIQLLLAQSSTLLGVVVLIAGIWLAITIHPAWTWFAILGLAWTGGSGFAAYRVSENLADLRRLLDGWREALIRVEAGKNTDAQEELDVYRVRSLGVVDELRHKANRNRRMHKYPSNSHHRWFDHDYKLDQH